MLGAAPHLGALVMPNAAGKSGNRHFGVKSKTANAAAYRPTVAYANRSSTFESLSPKQYDREPRDASSCQVHFRDLPEPHSAIAADRISPSFHGNRQQSWYGRSDVPSEFRKYSMTPVSATELLAYRYSRRPYNSYQESACTTRHNRVCSYAAHTCNTRPSVAVTTY